VLPVGHLLGPFFTSADTEIPESVDIRIGTELAPLPPDAYLVWAAAHGDPRAVAKAPMTRAATLARVGGAVSDADHVYRQLVSRHLLVEIISTKQGRRDFAENHRVLPLVLGLGNSPDWPEEFVVGMVGSPAVTLPASAFVVWMFGHHYHTLWQACENVAVGTVGIAGGGGVDPSLVLADVVALLPLLVTTGCACVDRRTDG
jgi:hypothetical protein